MPVPLEVAILPLIVKVVAAVTVNVETDPALPLQDATIPFTASETKASMLVPPAGNTTCGTLTWILVPVELTLATVAGTLPVVPTKITESAPSEVPKFRPEIVTIVPALPDVGDIPHTTGNPEFVTARLDEALWLSDPLVAVRAIVPDAVQGCVAAVRVSCTAWLVVRLTEEAGLKFTPVNAGGAGTVRLTVPVKPFRGVTVTVYAALAPAATVWELGAMPTLKSGVGACTTTAIDA
jgi:hypothetical protein